MDDYGEVRLDCMWMVRFPNGRFARTDDLDEDRHSLIQWTTKGGAFDGAYKIKRLRSLAGLDPYGLQVVAVKIGSAPERGTEHDVQVHEVDDE